MSLRVEKQKYPRTEAKAQWDAAAKETPKDSTDQQGPSHSRLRVPMPKEEYFDLANVVEHGKGFVMESNHRKISNAEDVAQAQGMLCTGHASFGNSMFDAVGGNIAAVASASFAATFKELVDKLISFVKESASECRKLIERNDKKSEAAALAEVRRAAAAKTKLAKKTKECCHEKVGQCS